MKRFQDATCRIDTCVFLSVSWKDSSALHMMTTRNWSHGTLAKPSLASNGNGIVSPLEPEDFNWPPASHPGAVSTIKRERETSPPAGKLSSASRPPVSQRPQPLRGNLLFRPPYADAFHPRRQAEPWEEPILRMMCARLASGAPKNDGKHKWS